MNGLTHHIVAFTVVGTAAFISKDTGTLLGLPVIPLALIPLGVAGGFKADMDQGNNPEGRALKPILWLMHKLPGLKKVFAHRGITHTLLIPVVAWLFASTLVTASTDNIVLAISTSILGWGLGYASHLVADLFNGKGIPICAPLVNKRVHIASLSTGTWEEYLFLFLWLVAIGSNFYFLYTGQTLN